MGAYYIFLTKDSSPVVSGKFQYLQRVWAIGQKVKEEIHVTHIKELCKCPHMIQDFI